MTNAITNIESQFNAASRLLSGWAEEAADLNTVKSIVNATVMDYGRRRGRAPSMMDEVSLHTICGRPALLITVVVGRCGRWDDDESADMPASTHRQLEATGWTFHTDEKGSGTLEYRLSDVESVDLYNAVRRRSVDGKTLSDRVRTVKAAYMSRNGQPMSIGDTLGEAVMMVAAEGIAK